MMMETADDWNYVSWNLQAYITSIVPFTMRATEDRSRGPIGTAVFLLWIKVERVSNSISYLQLLQLLSSLKVPERYNKCLLV